MEELVNIFAHGTIWTKWENMDNITAGKSKRYKIFLHGEEPKKLVV